jgi:hypothetical protein
VYVVYIMLPFVTKVTETASINETQLGEKSVEEAYHINYAYHFITQHILPCYFNYIIYLLSLAKYIMLLQIIHTFFKIILKKLDVPRTFFVHQHNLLSVNNKPLFSW